MTDKDLILKFLNNLRADLVQDLHDKEMSQGDLNMKAEAEDEGGELSGDAHYYYLVHGRRPGKNPPIDDILSWIQKKGIQPQDISERSLAFLIARKIGSVGTDIYLGKRPALALDELIELNNKTFSNELTEKYYDQFKETFLHELKLVFS